jgi:hypothetical protein
MAGQTPSEINSYIAGAAITKRRIVKWGAADGQVVVAAGPAATEFLNGVTSHIDAAINEPVDVFQGGIVDVEYGATVVRGAPLTSDSIGRAVTAAPAAGANNRIIGFAEVSGAVGDIGAVRINIGFMQG